MLFDKYLKKKRLGKGAYGDVYLATDQNEQEVAVKIISKKLIEKEDYLLQYLQSQIECMKEMCKSPYVVQIKEAGEDQDNYYITCEYCNMGDLINCQAKQPNKLYKQEAALEIIAEVLKGLEDLHGKNYLHRDLKPQNILLKKDQNGKIYYKLADFGFAKKTQNQIKAHTILGTQSFMAPEIYEGDGYGVEVDMWALGVVLYFMLNMSFPFKFTNPHQSSLLKRDELITQSKKFSYREYVDRSLKKVTENCTEDFQDLFLRIFESDPAKRLNFIQIRKHPLFCKYFPVISLETQNLYNSFHNSTLKNNKYILPQLKLNKEVSQLETFERQMKIVRKLRGKVDALDSVRENLIQIANKQKFLPEDLLASYDYNMHRIILLAYKRFYYTTLAQKNLKYKYLHCQWDSFLNTRYYKNLKKEYQNKISEEKNQLRQSFFTCEPYKDVISQYNPSFQNVFRPKAEDDTFNEDFRKSFLLVTRILYRESRKYYHTNKQNSIMKFMALSTMSHVGWRIIEEEQEKMESAFKEFFDDQKGDATLNEFTKWITVTDSASIKNVIKGMLNNYFQAANN